MPASQESPAPLTMSVAPMMDWTDRHCRYFMRLLNPSIRLYTEMVTAAAIYHGDADRLLRFDTAEHPVAVQLGGSDPNMMAHAAKVAEQHGYDEININVGCPSDRVQSGQFGACLMARPALVAECVTAIREVVSVPVTIKTRIGIDDMDNDEFLADFVGRTREAGCGHFIVHARIALLNGLSPKQNRSVPPLNYPRVFRLKERYPELRIEINGGFTTMQEIDAVRGRVDGVMIGRQAYSHPFFLAELALANGELNALPDRSDIVRAMLPYIEAQLANGEKLGRITRHMVGLFAGMPGARAWRRTISENAHRHGADVDVVLRALDAIPLAA